MIDPPEVCTAGGAKLMTFAAEAPDKSGPAISRWPVSCKSAPEPDLDQQREKFQWDGATIEHLAETTLQGTSEKPLELSYALKTNEPSGQWKGRRRDP